MTLRKRRLAVAGTLACLAGLVALGGAGYAKSDPAKHEATKTVAKFYGASRWQPANFAGGSKIEYAGQLIGSLDCLESGSQEGGAVFQIPLDLPDGARITKVDFYYFDTDPEAELRFFLLQHTVGVADTIEGWEEDGVSEDQPLWPEETNPGEAAAVTTVAGSAPLHVDNANRSYMAAVFFSECGTFTPFSEEESTFILADGVRVHYAPK